MTTASRIAGAKKRSAILAPPTIRIVRQLYLPTNFRK